MKPIIKYFQCFEIFFILLLLFQFLQIRNELDHESGNWMIIVPCVLLILVIVLAMFVAERMKRWLRISTMVVWAVQAGVFAFMVIAMLLPENRFYHNPLDMPTLDEVPYTVSFLFHMVKYKQSGIIHLTALYFNPVVFFNIYVLDAAWLVLITIIYIKRIMKKGHKENQVYGQN